MSESTRWDAVVVGAGPNGLAAAIELARAGLAVQVLEGAERIGGGTRSEPLTLPGHVHDVCSAIHPTGALSPCFRSLGLERWGLEWVEPEIALAHPLEGREAAVVLRSLDETARRLGPDAAAYRALLGHWVERADALLGDILGPIRMPRDPLLMARFGLTAVRSAAGVARRFDGDGARALLGGCAGHSMMPLDAAGTASFALVLLLSAHVASWPCARGGSQRIADALAACLRSLGGDIRTGRPVRSLRDLPPARAVLLDLTPRQVVEVAGEALPASYRSALARYRYGPGVFKLDWALDGPIPWADGSCRRAGTVHVGGTLEEIAASEAACWRGAHAERPFVLVAQPTVMDPTRAPPGRHTGWAYCHVPHGSTVDMTERVERQIERFAPGFRDRILARHAFTTADLERHNPNLVGGDIGGGANTLRQLLARPVARANPYATPNPALFLCSSSTPPGGGVHGMCGFHAARTVLRRRFGKR